MLPLAGGLLDQPGIYIAKMEQIIEARDEKERFDQKRTAGTQRLKGK